MNQETGKHSSSERNLKAPFLEKAANIFVPRDEADRNRKLGNFILAIGLTTLITSGAVGMHEAANSHGDHESSLQEIAAGAYIYSLFLISLGGRIQRMNPDAISNVIEKTTDYLVRTTTPPNRENVH